MAIGLDGKVALITGAAGEIGAATIQLLASRGARIVAIDRDADALERAVATLPASAQALAIAADVSKEEDVAGYVHKALDQMGGLDICFNNAGIEGDVTSIVNFPLDGFRRVLEVNVIGVFLGMKHVLPVMIAKNAGSIINTASIAGLIGTVNLSAYGASKHAVVGLTKSAALECTHTNVRVNCVCPGPIDTRMLSSIVNARNTSGEPVPVNKIVDRVPARRLGLAQEVAQVVAFLASDDASYVSGAAYTVDGGRTAG